MGNQQLINCHSFRQFPDKQTTAQTPALFNMRTSTQLLSGLGFLALLAPASAQSSSSIESSIESSFESSSTILPSSQSSSEIVSTTELSSTTGASSSSEVSSTQTSSEVSFVHDPFIVAVHLLRPILVDLGVLIVIDLELNIFVRNPNRFPICSILLDYPDRSLEETSTRIRLLFGCGQWSIDCNRCMQCDPTNCIHN